MANMLDLTALKDAITSLENGIAAVDDAAWFNAQSPIIRNTMMAGVIQNFEFVWDLSIKMIRRRIEMDAATPTEADHSDYRDLMRAAGERGLVADVEAWFEYRKLRNVTSHTYDAAKARATFSGIPSFLDAARHLLTRLPGITRAAEGDSGDSRRP
jgi:nucleotidyltransferase substrate binding protein (TIGR01987 family)